MSQEDVWRIIKRAEQDEYNLQRKLKINPKNETLKRQLEQNQKLLKQYYSYVEAS